MKDFKRYVLGARARGFSHELHNKVCQDALSSFSKAEYDILTVADGHGGDAYIYSDKGSECATMVFRRVMKSIVNDHTYNGVVNLEDIKLYLKNNFNKIAENIVGMWKSHVIEVYKREHHDVDTVEGKQLSDKEIVELYGSTLLGSLVTPEYVYCFQLGDGNMAIVSEDKAEMVFEDDGLPGTQTYSLCLDDATLHVKQRIIDLERSERKKPVMIWLSTDGFYNSYASEDDFLFTLKAYLDESFYLRGLRRKQAKRQLKQWLADTSRNGSADDITVMMDVIFPGVYT